MHVHKMHTHTSSFFLISFKDFETWGVPVDLVAKRMTKSRSDIVLQQALRFLSSFPLPLIIFHPHASLLVTACPWGWFTQIMLM